MMGSTRLVGRGPRSGREEGGGAALGRGNMGGRARLGLFPTARGACLACTGGDKPRWAGAVLEGGGGGSRCAAFMLRCAHAARAVPAQGVAGGQPAQPAHGQEPAPHEEPREAGGLQVRAGRFFPGPASRWALLCPLRRAVPPVCSRGAALGRVGSAVGGSTEWEAGGGGASGRLGRQRPLRKATPALVPPSRCRKTPLVARYISGKVALVRSEPEQQ